MYIYMDDSRFMYRANRLVQEVLGASDPRCSLPGEELEQLMPRQLHDSRTSRLAAALLVYGTERAKKWAVRQLQTTEASAVGIVEVLMQQEVASRALEQPSSTPLTAFNGANLIAQLLLQERPSRGLCPTAGA